MSVLDVLIITPGGREKIYQGLGQTLTAIEPPLWSRIIAGYLLDRDHSVFKKRKIIDLFEEEEKDSASDLKIMSTLPQGFNGIDLTDPSILSSTTGWSLFPF